MLAFARAELLDVGYEMEYAHAVKWTAQPATAIPARVSRAPPAQTAHADCLGCSAPTPLAENDVGDVATRAPCCCTYFYSSSDGLPGVPRAPRAPIPADTTCPYVILAVPTLAGRGLFLYGLCDDDPCLQRTCEQE